MKANKVYRLARGSLAAAACVGHGYNGCSAEPKQPSRRTMHDREPPDDRPRAKRIGAGMGYSMINSSPLVTRVLSHIAGVQALLFGQGVD